MLTPAIAYVLCRHIATHVYSRSVVNLGVSIIRIGEARREAIEAVQYSL